MKIQKPWISWEEFEQIVGGNWTPAAHTHVKADITDTPWAWADVSKAGSNLTDLATWEHAAEHEVGGGDLLAFVDITGFGDYLDQAVKQASNVQFDDIVCGSITSVQSFIASSQRFVVRATPQADTGYLDFNINNNSIVIPETDGYLKIVEYGSWDELMRITAAGRVGIGEPAPAYKVEITDPSTCDLAIHSLGDTFVAKLMFLHGGANEVATMYTNGFTGEVRVGGISASYFLTLYSGNAEAMRITTAGLVGIGTASPDELLDIRGSGSANTYVKIVSGQTDIGADYNTGIKFSANRGGVGEVLGELLFYNEVSGSPALTATIAAVRGGGDEASELIFRTRAPAGVLTTALTIDDSQNVGVGRTPTQQFDVYKATGNVYIKVETGAVNSAAGIMIIGGASDEARVFFGDVGNTSAGRIIYYNNTHDMKFWTNSALAMTITSAGWMGIKKIPTCELDVNGTIKATTWFLNLGGLLDVTLGSVEEGETIRYDQATAHWIDAWGIDYDNPRLVYKMWTEFFSPGTTTNDPWVGAALAGGNCAAAAATSNHPGLIRLSSTTTIASGYRFMTAVDCIRIAGAEHSEFIFQTPPNFTNVYTRLGFQDVITSGAVTDGVYISLIANVLAGQTRNNTASSTTGTNYTLAVSTWYRAKIAVNSDATGVSFWLYSSAGVILWTDTLAANIPTAAGRELGHGFVTWVGVGSASKVLIVIDMMIATRAGYITR